MYLISLTLKYINTYMNKPLSKLKPILSPCSYELMLLKWSEVNWSEVAQSCPTLCDPMDWSPPGSSVHGIFQARVLEWGAIAFSGETLLLIPISHHIYKVHIHLPLLSPTYCQSKKKKKKKCHTNQYQRKVKIHWSFCNKVQERLHTAHYLYSH